MIDRLPVTDQDLSDLIDGRLSLGREQEVRRALEEQPDLARRYARMIEQDRMLRRLGEEVLAEPVPAAMVDLLRRREIRSEGAPEAVGRPETHDRRRLRPATLTPLAALLVGLLLGWFGHVVLGPSEAGMFQDAVRSAALSHQMFETSGEPQPMADLGDSDVLPVSGLPRLFGTPVRAPVLSGSNWVPVGLKAETGTAGNAMQIAYADADGTIVTLFVRPLSEADDVPVNRVQAEGYDVLYWIDGPLIYALVGDQDEAALVDLARRIYAARASGGAWSESAPVSARPAAAPAGDEAGSDP